MEIPEHVLNAALAGLLHDVGKLEQRARDKPWEPAPGIDREGQPVHATWTTHFIQDHVPASYRPAAYAGAYHHNPERSPAADIHLSELVAVADKLSAGERADLPDDKHHPPRQMVTLFDQVVLDQVGKQGDWHYLPLKPLSLNSSALFPGAALPARADLNPYAALVEELGSAAIQDFSDPSDYLENLLAAMQRLTWCVPSAYYHSLPDVSLYDHSRMTAALAACMADMQPAFISQLLGALRRDFENKPAGQDQALLETPVALLVGGDFSGIQDFIYTLSSKGAAKMLRGRSLYLQLLNEAVLRFILSELGLPYANVIYSGGGHFFLLAPVSAADRLAEIQRTVSQKLMRCHGASLYLALGYCAVPANGFKIDSFRRSWDRMHRNMAEAKQRRYLEFGEELYARIFEAPEWGGNPNDVCDVCGEDRFKTQKWDQDHDVEICPLCRSFAETLGGPLPGAAFIALSFGAPAEPRQEVPPGALDVLAEYGMQVQFLKDAHETVALPRPVVWALSDPKDGRWPQAGQKPAVKWLHYAVNQVPPVTFDELQEKVIGGLKRLGVLRMDVDNLGDIFKIGLIGKDSLARLSTLSLQMSLYFEGWVKEICERDEYKGLIYAVYAGGDDLFLIGPWDRMPALAQTIRNEFAEYTGGHPAIHLSGGLAFIDGKYPVYQAAADAADALEEAKGSGGKNAFAFLGAPWKWEQFASLSTKQARLLKLVSASGVDPENLGGPQALLQLLRQLAGQSAAQEKKSKGRPVWGPWVWRGAYQLTRMAERYQRSKPELAAELLAIRDELALDNYQTIQQWGAAARWAQLFLR